MSRRANTTLHPGPLARLGSAVGRFRRSVPRGPDGDPVCDSAHFEAWMDPERPEHPLEPAAGVMIERLERGGMASIAEAHARLAGCLTADEMRRLLAPLGAPEEVRLALLLRHGAAVDPLLVADLIAVVGRGRALSLAARDELRRLVAARPELRLGSREIEEIVMLAGPTDRRAPGWLRLVQLQGVEVGVLPRVAGHLVLATELWRRQVEAQGRADESWTVEAYRPRWLRAVLGHLVENTMLAEGVGGEMLRRLGQRMDDTGWREHPFDLDGWRTMAAADPTVAAELLICLGPELWPGLERRDLAALLARAPRELRLRILQRVGRERGVAEGGPVGAEGGEALWGRCGGAGGTPQAGG